MANELTVNASLKFVKGSTSLFFQLLDDLVTVSGDRFVWQRQSVGTSEEAIGLGDIATGGYFLAINRDTTNFVSIRQATGGTNFIRMNAGEGCVFRIHASSAAPYWIADTAACEVEYLLIAA